MLFLFIITSNNPISLFIPILNSFSLIFVLTINQKFSIMNENKLIARATELKEMYELGFIHLWQFKDEIQKVADYYGVTYGCVISLI